MNLRMNYVYRDAGNNKNRTHVVFLNPHELTPEVAMRRMQRAASHWAIFEGAIHFLPGECGLGSCTFVDAGYAQSEDDLDLHEVEEFEVTEEAATEQRTISDFLADVLARRSHRPYRGDRTMVRTHGGSVGDGGS